MTKQLNVSGLLHSPTHSCLIRNGRLGEKDEDELMSARREVRSALREGLRERELVVDGRVLGPRFFTQGSMAYRTIVHPQQPPEQQADLDDGVYLPVEYMMQEEKPTVAAQAYIGATDAILSALADRCNWSFVSKNDCCSRLVLCDNKHIDVPRYALPYEEFTKIVEAKARQNDTALNLFKAEADFADDNWDMMPTEGVLLAHRTLGWIKSDPRPVRDWVIALDRDYNGQFRKIVKIIKLWRDFHSWKTEEPKSILLMAAIEIALRGVVLGRLDQTLTLVCRRMPQVLAGEVPHPTDSNDLAQGLDENGTRQEVRRRFSDLSESLDYVLYRCDDAETACDRLSAQFGPLMPHDPKRVLVETVQESRPVRVESAPIIGSTRSA